MGISWCKWMIGSCLDVPTHSETAKKLVAQRLALSNGRKTAVLNLFSVEFERIFGEFESFLNEGSKFTDTAALLSKDFLGMGGTDDNLNGRFPLIKNLLEAISQR